MDPTVKYFLLGCAGALAPEIVRLFSIAKSEGQFTFSWFYVIVSLVFAGLGGLVAVIMGGENMRSAFYTGISTPVIINTVLKKANARRKKKVAKGGGGMGLAAPRPSRADTFLDAL